MHRLVPLAGLLFLVFLVASSFPRGDPGHGRSSLSLDSRLPAPDGPAVGLPHRKALVEGIPLDTVPPDEGGRRAASIDLTEFSGGPTGTLLIVAALLAAVALIVAVVIPW
jgi:hypothetical protein